MYLPVDMYVDIPMLHPLAPCQLHPGAFAPTVWMGARAGGGGARGRVPCVTGALFAFLFE